MLFYVLLHVEIKTFTELIDNKDIKLFMTKSSPIRDHFKNSKSIVHKRIYNRIQEERWYVNSREEGWKRLGKYKETGGISI